MGSCARRLCADEPLCCHGSVVAPSGRLWVVVPEGAGGGGGIGNRDAGCFRDVGTLAEPRLDLLERLSRPSPFGDLRTNATVADEGVRLAREIPASSLAFSVLGEGDRSGPHLNSAADLSPSHRGVSQGVCVDVNHSSGRLPSEGLDALVESDPFRAVLCEVHRGPSACPSARFPHKLNIYGRGGFFAAHVDTPVSPESTVATLVLSVGSASRFTDPVSTTDERAPTGGGGRLRISHAGANVRLDLSRRELAPTAAGSLSPLDRPLLSATPECDGRGEGKGSGAFLADGRIHGGTAVAAMEGGGGFHYGSRDGEEDEEKEEEEGEQEDTGGRSGRGGERSDDVGATLLRWVAFHTDCVHEVEPIDEGRRATLTFKPRGRDQRDDQIYFSYRDQLLYDCQRPSPSSLSFRGDSGAGGSGDQRVEADDGERGGRGQEARESGRGRWGVDSSG